MVKNREGFGRWFQKFGLAKQKKRGTDKVRIKGVCRWCISEERIAYVCWGKGHFQRWSYIDITGYALMLQTSFLQNRTQFIHSNSQASIPVPILTRVPQGSVLTTLSQNHFSTFDFFSLFRWWHQLCTWFPAATSQHHLGELDSTFD